MREKEEGGGGGREREVSISGEKVRQQVARNSFHSSVVSFLSSPDKFVSLIC